MSTLEELAADLKRVFIDNPFGYTLVVTMLYRRFPRLAPFAFFMWSLYKWHLEH